MMAGGGGAPRRHLSSQARERLLLSARLMRATGAKIDDGSGFYEGVELAVSRLTPDARMALWGRVDWVQSYIVEESRLAALRRGHVAI
jgi:hypothetical protein